METEIVKLLEITNGKLTIIALILVVWLTAWGIAKINEKDKWNQKN